VVVRRLAQGQRRIRGGAAVMVDRPAVGPRIGYDFDFDHVFVGGQLNLPCRASLGARGRRRSFFRAKTARRSG